MQRLDGISTAGKAALRDLAFGSAAAQAVLPQVGATTQSNYLMRPDLRAGLGVGDLAPI